MPAVPGICDSHPNSNASFLVPQKRRSSILLFGSGITHFSEGYSKLQMYLDWRDELQKPSIEASECYGLSASPGSTQEYP
jgi:hypothetical protein